MRDERLMARCGHADVEMGRAFESEAQLLQQAADRTVIGQARAAGADGADLEAALRVGAEAAAQVELGLAVGVLVLVETLGIGLPEFHKRAADGPVIEPQVAPPELNLLSVAVRAAASAESLMLIVVWLGGFWMLRAPRMPCTLPALPTVTVSCPPLLLRLVVRPVASTLTVSLPVPVVILTPDVSAYL